jgi:hypothetical protein
MDHTSQDLDFLYLNYLPFEWWIWPRDFCIQQYILKEANGKYLIAQRSARLPSCPSKSGYLSGTVRGHFSAGYIIEERLKNNGTKSCIVTYVYNYNLKGFLQYLPLNFISNIYKRRFSSFFALKDFILQNSNKIEVKKKKSNSKIKTERIEQKSNENKVENINSEVEEGNKQEEDGEDNIEESIKIQKEEDDSEEEDTSEEEEEEEQEEQKGWKGAEFEGIPENYRKILDDSGMFFIKKFSSLFSIVFLNFSYFFCNLK